MANYPLPKFHFQVQWGGERIGFTEVTGLDIQIEAIEYREGSSPEYSKIKMPGMPKYSNITLKRGSMNGDSDFYKWINTTALNLSLIHISEPTRLGMISYAVFCLKTKKKHRETKYKR